MKTLVVYNRLPESLLKRLEEHFSVILFEKITEENRASFVEALPKADALLGAGYPINEELLSQAENLRYVGNVSAGYNNFDLEAMTERGVMAVNAPNALTDTTADLIFGLLLSAARRITELDRRVRRREWTASAGREWFGLDVHHKTIGIVGMGKIGKAVAKRAALGFDMNVLYYKRKRDLQAEQELGAEFVGLQELLASSDFVVLTLPLNQETYHIIDGQSLGSMKSQAMLVNGGRGSLVDEEALIEALANGTIAGAGLDVFEEEPLAAGSPLLNLENVVLAPHIGSAVEATRYAMAEEAVENLFQWNRGEKPVNLLNP